MKDINKIVGDHWSQITEMQISNTQLKLRWWQSPHIIKHINKIVCGEEISGFSQGLIQLARSRAKSLIPFEKGISVGGGTGQKEMNLLRQNIVKTFELYELSEVRIAQGIEMAKKQSLEERIRFIHGDAFDLITKNEQYDFVHWNNSLHHMLNVDKAVEWSKVVLKVGGLFYMDDYIGSSRFQWPDEQLDIATRIRKVFEKTKYLIDPRYKDRYLPTTVRRPDEKKHIEIDPSEAADSDRIVSAIYKHFPNAEIKITGGVVYHLALNDMLNNFDETDDKILLDLLMIIDELCTNFGQTHYAVALAFKEG